MSIDTAHDVASEGAVTYSVTDRIAHIVLTRPEKLNALTPAMLSDLRAAFHRLELDDDADVAIVSGSGRAFCTGADTSLHRDSADVRNARTLADPRRQLFEECLHWKPIIAATHGFSLGYGMVLALKCDFVVAEADTRFQIAEIPRGLYGSGLWALLSFRSTVAFADEMTLTGRFAVAGEMLERGVINAVAAPGQHVARAEEFARAMIANPQLAVRDAVRCRRTYQARFCADAALLTRAAPSPFNG